MSEKFARLRDLQQAAVPAVRLVVYYGVLAALYVVLTSVSPWFEQHLGLVPQLPAGGARGELFQSVAPSDPAEEAGLVALLTMASALLLALPVVWVYTFARQKKGFQQSLAQTLIMLPIVVAVVVVLVKHSVALAFSLGGIVGAVAFRHRLEDTKDAVYIFVTIAIGLAIGVQAYTVGYAASVFYNLVMLGLWATDFARAPAPLAPKIMQKRVELAKGIVGGDRRTGEYVAQLDRQLLQSMTPDQLKALADRALQRKDNYLAEIADIPDPREILIRTVAPNAAVVPGIRLTIEAILEREAKTWSFERETAAPAGAVELWYRARYRKRMPAELLIDSIKRQIAALTHDVSLE
jgi:hypothetical protein